MTTKTKPPTWTTKDATAADREGWDLFESDVRGWEIEACNDSPIFKRADGAVDDRAACDFVIHGAAMNQKPHYRRALRYLVAHGEGSARHDARVALFLCEIADACVCVAHRGKLCPGADCDGCRECPSGEARRILAGLGEPQKEDDIP